MGKFDPQYFCAVCGHKFKGMTRQELIAKGCTLIQESGQEIHHCSKHSPEEVQKMIKASPRFSTGNKYREYASE